MNPVIRKLKEGDLRQKGRSEEVVADVFKEPQLFRHVVAGMVDIEPGVRMRASDAVEKITRLRPELLHPYKKDFLIVSATIDQKEVRWHLAQILPRLELTKKERQQVFDILVSFLDDDSRIVKTFAMQGLADIAEMDRSYLPRVVKIVEDLMASGIPAIQSRGNKLLPRLTEVRPNKALSVVTRHSLRLAGFKKTRLVPCSLTFILQVALLLSVAGCTGTRPFTDAYGRVIPGSIATMEQVPIGGIPQSIWFRGVDTRMPAVILLHGGPGISESALFRHYDAALEKHFLMVYWEQRGAGRSYHSDIPRASMTIAQFERDLDEVVELVRRRFGKDKVILLAHSWGTELGTIYTYRHPEKVAAYVGIGQVASFAEDERVSYEWALTQATTRDNRRAITELRAMSPGPRSVDDELAKGKWVEAFGGVFHQDLSTGKLILAALSTDEANLVDLVKFGQGNRFSLESLRPEYSKLDLTRYRVFQVPIVFLLGRYDWQVPSVQAEQYFNTIDAPCKRLIWFEQSAHNPPFEEPERFVHVMVDEVFPLVAGRLKVCAEWVSLTKHFSRPATPAEFGRWAAENKLADAHIGQK